MPRFGYVSMRGGVFANAVALPSSSGSSVLFTDTLLSRLSEDETIAICAHELAHLEHFDGARLRKANVASHLLIAAAAATAPLARVLSGSPGPGPFLWVWPCAVIVALFQVASHRQKNETASDLRAVALTGDAEALARALITLHTIARVPRRWAQERERQSTHPSLARRIRDIRASAGAGRRDPGRPDELPRRNRRRPRHVRRPASQLAGRDRRDACARLRRSRGAALECVGRGGRHARRGGAAGTPLADGAQGRRPAGAAARPRYRRRPADA